MGKGLSGELILRSASKVLITLDKENKNRQTREKLNEVKFE